MADLKDDLSNYPNFLDTYPIPLAATDKTSHKPPSGAIKAVINLQTILDANVSQSKSDLATYINASHNADGTHIVLIYTTINFQTLDMAANQTSIACDVADFTLLTGICIPRAGSIIGIGLSMGGGASAGNCRIKPTINGTESDLVALLDTGQNLDIEIQDAGIDTFVVEDLIGAKFTTSADWAPATKDVFVSVYVTFQ